MSHSTTVHEVMLAHAAANVDTTPLPAINTLGDAPETVRAVLDRLHKASAEQEAGLKIDNFKDMTFDEAMTDKFIALEQDKCEFMYTLLRGLQATTIVEAGTSYGVSTIYLALAAAANAKHTGATAHVIGTEHEEKKAVQARKHWDECGPAISDVIELRVGDLRETLKTNIGSVDFLLLDIWVPMALPTLKLIQPKLRRGAAVLTDNTTSAGKSYRELLTYLRDPVNGFVNVTLPYKGGLELSIYQPAN